jgi:outer membrane protein assembly factor BamE (lipoprotein component of BamABCDE complex)
MRTSPFLPFALAAILLSGCAMQRAEDAENAQHRMVGMTKEQVFACMGIPKRKGVEGNVEIWAYNSGNGYSDSAKSSASLSKTRSTINSDDNVITSLTGALGFEDTAKEKRFCTVQVVMTEGRVTAVHYNGPTGGFMSDDEQCAYAVRNCISH